MLRDKSLIPLSRQHQHALALCVGIERAVPIPQGDVKRWQAQVEQHFRSEIGIHFAAEEKLVFPAARRFEDLVPVVEELIAEHGALRGMFERASRRELTADELRDFAGRLSGHIRKEERVLFEGLQQMMSAEEMAALGAKLDEELKKAVQACAVHQKD